MIYPKSYSIRNMKGRLCVRIWIEKEEDFYSKKKYNKTEPFDSFDYMYSTLAMAKNGEIFEGDIIAFGSSLNDIGIVEFSRVTGGFVTLVHGKIIQIRGNMRNCEILGDLFQDRFLLRRVRENMVAAKKQFMENLKEKGVDALTPESPKRVDEMPKRAVPTFEEEVQDIIKEESSSVVQEEHLPKEEEALKQEEISQNPEGVRAEIEKKTPEKKEVLTEEAPMKTGDAALSLLKNLVSKKEEQEKVKEEVSSKKKEEEKQDQKEPKKSKKEENVLDIKEERLEEPKILSEKEEEQEILPKEETAEKEVSSKEEESLKEDLSKEEVLPPYAIEPPEEPKGKEPEEAEVLAEEDSEEPEEPLEEPLPPEEEALDSLSFEAELPEEIPEEESRKDPPAPSEESAEGPFSKKEISSKDSLEKMPPAKEEPVKKETPSFPKEEPKVEKKEEKLQLFTPEEIEEEEKEIDLDLERKVQEKTERRGKEKEKESSKDFPEKEPLEVKKEKEFSKKESPVLPKKEIKVSQSKPTKEKEVPLEEEGPAKKPPIPLSGKKKEDFSGKAEKKEVKDPVKEKVVAPEISKKKEEKKTIPPVKKEEPHVTRKKSASEDLLEALMTLKQGNQKDSSKKVKPEVLSSKKEGFSEKAIDQAKKEIKQTDSIDSLIEKAGEDLEEINGDIHSFSEESRLYFAFVYDEKKESSFIQGVIKENNKDDFVFSEQIYSKEEKEASLLSFIYVLNLMKECACYKVFTNSSYLVMPFVRGFLERWMKNGWLREDGYPVSYQDKWLTIYQIMKEKRIEIVHSQKNQTTKRQMQKAESFRKSA